MMESGVQTTPEARLSIRARLILGSSVALLLLLISGLVNIWALAQLDQATSAFQKEADRVAAAREAAWASADLLATVGHATSLQDTTYLKEAVGEARAALYDIRERLIETIADLPEDDEVQVEARRAYARMISMDFLAHLVVSAAQGEDWGSASFYATQMLTAYREIAVPSLARVVTLTEGRQTVAAREATAVRRLAMSIPAGSAVLALAVTAVTIAATIRSIAGPVAQLAKAAARLAAGHLEERVPVGGSDELGHLATVFNEMASRLQTSYAELEDRVAERTYALQRRATQLEASAEVARAITSILDVDQLLRQTVDLIRERFGFYHAGIFLLDDTGEWMVLREATGEAGGQMKAQGHRLAVGETSMVGWTALRCQPRVAPDVGKDGVHFAHPLLPHTHSEMTLPLMVGGRLLGVLDVQSTQEAAFDEGDVRTLRSMANQVAVAIENARRVSEEATLLEAASPIYRVGRHLTMATTVAEVADAIIASVADTGADGGVVILYEFSPAGEPEALFYAGVWRRDREPQFKPGLRLPLAESPVPVELGRTLWVVPDVTKDDRLPESTVRMFEATGVAAAANIPLRTKEKVIGQVVVLRNTSGPFSDAATRLYQALADQAAVAVERALLLEATRRRVDQEVTLRAIGDRLARAVDLETVLSSTAEELGRVLQASGVCIELALESPTLESLESVEGSGG